MRSSKDRETSGGSNSTCRGTSAAGIPVGDFGFGAGLTDAMNGGQQEVVSRSGTRARRRPKREEEVEDAEVQSGEPESAGRAEVERSSGQGDGGGAVLDEGGDPLGGAEVGLVDDAGLASTRALSTT